MVKSVTTGHDVLQRYLCKPDLIDQDFDLNKIHQDFYEFFTANPDKDMLAYAYLADNSYYDDLLLKNPDYYLFRDEIAIIKENATKLSQHLQDVKEIIELGPGYGHVLECKTLPLLDYAPNMKEYHAVDISENYLKKLREFFKSCTGYKISTIQADFLDGSLMIPKINGTRATLFLGSTLGNFNLQEQSRCMRQIAEISFPGDKLIFTIDVNHEEATLLKAYENNYAWNFALNILRFYALFNYEFGQFIRNFSVSATWNSQEKAVEIDFIAKSSFVFKIKNHGLVKVIEGQRFKPIKSRKFDIPAITKLLESAGFAVKDQICYDEKVSMIIAIKL